jgi:hypothetical protein
MKDIKKKYLQILCVELEDLQEDLRLLIDASVARREKNEISSYVCQENLALLRSEIVGINRLCGEIASASAQEYEDLNALIEAVRGKINAMISRHALAEAVRRLVDRRLDKVYRYVQDDYGAAVRS